MSCTNCYNGCTEIVSDKCIKYTGVDVPVLGILNGDSLSVVEQSLITFLTSTLDGTGIKIDLNPETLCEFVEDYLPTCGDITLVDVLNALTAAVCFLKEETLALQAKFSELEQGYVIDCLEGSPDATSTYEVLQATINKLCGLEDDLIALALDVDTNYVKLADLNTLIQAYLDETGSSTKFFNRMVPYTAVEYYGTLANFDGSGAGLGDWEQIYLCNGDNGTPDKRGRSPIGVIQGVPSTIPLSSVVDPAIPGNQNYSISGVNSTNGANNVTLTTAQIASHTHTATAIVTDPGHRHNWGYGTEQDDDNVGGSYDEFTLIPGENGDQPESPVQTATTGITVAVTNAAQGGGQSHNNVHPVLACYYIMYIPN